MKKRLLSSIIFLIFVLSLFLKFKLGDSSYLQLSEIMMFNFNSIIDDISTIINCFNNDNLRVTDGLYLLVTSMIAPISLILSGISIVFQIKNRAFNIASFVTFFLSTIYIFYIIITFNYINFHYMKYQIIIPFICEMIFFIIMNVLNFISLKNEEITGR